MCFILLEKGCTDFFKVPQAGKWHQCDSELTNYSLHVISLPRLFRGVSRIREKCDCSTHHTCFYPTASERPRQRQHSLCGPDISQPPQLVTSWGLQPARRRMHRAGTSRDERKKPEDKHGQFPVKITIL